MSVPMRGEGADGLVVAKKPGNAGGAREPDDLARNRYPIGLSIPIKEQGVW